MSIGPVAVVRAQPWWVWISVIVIALIAFLPYRFLSMPPMDLAIVAAERSSSGEPAGDTVALPDDWSRAAIDELQQWYRLDVKAAGSPATAIYLPFVSQNAALWVDGHWLDDGGSMEPPIARNWNRPLMFTVDSSLLGAARDVGLHVRAPEPGTDYLGRVFVGPRAIIEPFYERHMFWRAGIERSLTTALVLFGCFILIIWFLRREESSYLWFALSAFFWACHELNLFITEIPVSDRIWEIGVITTLGYSILCLQVFVHQFINLRINWLRYAMVVYAILGPLPMYFLDLPGVRLYGYVGWLSLLMPLGGFTIWRLMQHHARHQDQATALMAASGMWILPLAGHDLMLANFLIDRETAHLLQFGALASIATIGIMLIRRFVSALEVAESFSEQLEISVREKEAELKGSYERLGELEKTAALNQERDRIMRDIHDGVGGQLVAAMTVLEETNTDQAARESLAEALSDLRLVIDSLDIEADDLATTLGMIRARMDHKLSAAGIHLNWQVDDLPEIEGYGP